MDYEKKYKEALSRAATELETCGADKSLRNMIYAIFPDELKESKDEKIRNRILLSLEKDLMATKNSGCDTQDLEQCIAWLEKQGESYTKKDIDDAYLKGICDAKHELEKQGTPAKLSEEEQNRFAKGILSSCALSFINYLDAHSYEGKMCVSNGECEDIENAFHNAMWDRLHRYYCKYIEKQGEQKPVIDFKASNWYVSKVDGKIHDMTYNPTDKVEPKFKVGDFIVNDYCMGRVIEITNDAYLLDTEQGIPFSCEHNIHLWTIQDAKDGDVLATDNGVCIFNGTLEEGKYPLAYCGITARGFDFYNVDLPFSNDNNIHPATKEQRNTLFTKMKEAGYEWNADKKELKKADVELTDFEKSLKHIMIETLECGDTHNLKADAEMLLRFAQKPIEWSEEDEEHVESILERLEGMCKKGATFTATRFAVNQDMDWLKSLKERISWETK